MGWLKFAPANERIIKEGILFQIPHFSFVPLILQLRKTARNSDFSSKFAKPVPLAKNVAVSYEDGQFFSPPVIIAKLPTSCIILLAADEKGKVFCPQPKFLH